MLEHRPVAKKALYGSGAFMFVFAAAMLGTAFMISGGFGFNGPDRSYSPPVVYQAWGDWSQSAEQTRPAPARVASVSAPASDQPGFVVDAIMPPAAAEETQTDDTPQQADDAYVPDIQQDDSASEDAPDKPKAEPNNGA